MVRLLSIVPFPARGTSLACWRPVIARPVPEDGGDAGSCWAARRFGPGLSGRARWSRSEMARSSQRDGWFSDEGAVRSTPMVCGIQEPHRRVCDMVRKLVGESLRRMASVGWAALLAVLLALFAGAPRSQAYEERSPEPTADYASLLAARDSVGTMIDRVVRVIGGPAHESIRVSRAPARFKYWYAGDSANGWAYRIVVSDTLGRWRRLRQHVRRRAGLRGNRHAGSETNGRCAP